MDLSGATTLTYLKLYRNHIAQLSNDSFSRSPNLRYLIAPTYGLTGEFPPVILDKSFLEILSVFLLNFPWPHRHWGRSF